MCQYVHVNRCRIINWNGHLQSSIEQHKRPKTQYVYCIHNQIQLYLFVFQCCCGGCCVYMCVVIYIDIQVYICVCCVWPECPISWTNQQAIRTTAPRRNIKQITAPCIDWIHSYNILPWSGHNIWEWMTSVQPESGNNSINKQSYILGMFCACDSTIYGV